MGGSVNTSGSLFNDEAVLIVAVEEIFIFTHAIFIND
jgi:hypothetical protein